MSSIETGEGYIRHFNREHPEFDIGPQLTAPTAPLDVSERTEDCVLSEDRPAVDAKHVDFSKYDSLICGPDVLPNVIIDREFGRIFYNLNGTWSLVSLNWLEITVRMQEKGIHIAYETAFTWKRLDGLWVPQDYKQAAPVPAEVAFVWRKGIVGYANGTVWRQGADGKWVDTRESVTGLRLFSTGRGVAVDEHGAEWSVGADRKWNVSSPGPQINPPSAPGGAGDYVPAKVEVQLESTSAAAAPMHATVDAGTFADAWVKKVEQAFADEPPLLQPMKDDIRDAWLKGTIEQLDAAFPRGAELNKVCDCHTKVNQVCDRCCGGRGCDTSARGAECPARLLTEDEWLGRAHRPDASKGAGGIQAELNTTSPSTCRYSEEGRIKLVDLGNGVSINPRFVMAVEGGGLATLAGVRSGVAVVMMNGTQYRFDTPLQHPQAPYRALSGQERADIAELARRRILELLGSPGYYATELQMPPAELDSPAADGPFYTT